MDEWMRKLKSKEINMYRDQLMSPRERKQAYSPQKALPILMS